MSLKSLLNAFGRIAAGVATTMWNAVKQLVAACGLRTASNATGEPSTSMSENDTITEELRPTIHGDVMKPHIDPTAAKYVIQHGEEDALNYITEKIVKFTPDEKKAQLPDDREELRQAVEWYVRENYQHVSAP